MLREEQNIIDILEDCDLEFTTHYYPSISDRIFTVEINFGKNNKTPFFIDNVNLHHRVYQSCVKGMLADESREIKREAIDILNGGDVMMKRIFNLTRYKLSWYSILRITGPYPEYEVILQFEKPSNKIRN